LGCTLFVAKTIVTRHSLSADFLFSVPPPPLKQPPR
jgi:hypothetical protein